MTAEGFTDEAVTWGDRRRTATTTVTEVLTLVIDATRATDGDERVLDAIRQQAEKITRTERVQ